LHVLLDGTTRFSVQKDGKTVPPPPPPPLLLLLLLPLASLAQVRILMFMGCSTFSEYHPSPAFLKPSTRIKNALQVHGDARVCRGQDPEGRSVGEGGSSSSSSSSSVVTLCCRSVSSAAA
jgi:hypothetical protein